MIIARVRRTTFACLVYLVDVGYAFKDSRVMIGSYLERNQAVPAVPSMQSPTAQIPSGLANSMQSFLVFAKWKILNESALPNPVARRQPFFETTNKLFVIITDVKL